MVSGVTDYLDGYLARKLDQTSQLGQILDPVADRLYILAVVVGLALRDIIPWWVALSLPLRDLLLWGLVPLLRTRGYSALPVHFLGKAATFNLLYAFPLLLLGDGDGAVATLAKVFGWAFALWGIGLYWWAGLLYAWQVLHAARTHRARNGRGATDVRWRRCLTATGSTRRTPAAHCPTGDDAAARPHRAVARRGLPARGRAQARSRGAEARAAARARPPPSPATAPGGRRRDRGLRRSWSPSPPCRPRATRRTSRTPAGTR